jgi:hypothetical protein
MIARWLLLAALLTLSTSLRAGEPSLADKETARGLMDRGYERLDRRDFAGALDDFRGADAIMAVPTTGLAVGKALEGLGKLIEARDKLLAVVRIAPKPDESDAFRGAREQADKLQTELAERIPALKLEIVGLAAGKTAAVTIDGETIPPAIWSLPRKVNPGSHVLRATAAGYRDVEQQLTIAEREQKTATLNLVPADGASVTHAGSGRRRLSPFLWVGVAVTGAGLVAGSITGGLSLAAASEAKKDCNDNLCPRSAEPAANRSLSLAHVSTASFVLAGLGAGVLAYGLYDSALFGGDKKKAAITPMIGPAAVALRGSF